MRVLVLSQYYDPEPVPKAGELARALRDKGHDVQVLTGFPNYPTGQLYGGYRRRFYQRETSEGIVIHRTYEFPYHSRSILGRLLNYGSFMVSAALGSILLKEFDVIYVWHPPLTIGVTAWLIGRLRGAPFVYDVQDIWPDTALLSGMVRDGSLMVRVMSAFERFVYRKATHLFVVTEAARQNVIAKGVPAEKVSTMPHWIDEEMFAPVPESVRSSARERLQWNGHFVIAFAGNIGMVQGLDTLIESAAHIPCSSKVFIAIVGDGSDKKRLVELARERGVTGRIAFVERQPMEAMPAVMAAADALLVHLRKSDLSRLVIPTKTLAYLGAGRPIVMAMEGAAADLVAEAGAGILIEPESPVELAEAMCRLERMSNQERAAYGMRGREYLLANLRRDHVIQGYENALLAASARTLEKNAVPKRASP